MRHRLLPGALRVMDVGIGEQEPIGRGRAGGHLEGVVLAEPAGRQGLDVDDAECGGLGGEAVEDRARRVGRSVVHRDDLDARIILRQHRSGRQFNPCGLVARREDHGEGRPAAGRGIVGKIRQRRTPVSVSQQGDQEPEPEGRRQDADRRAGPPQGVHPPFPSPRAAGRPQWSSNTNGPRSIRSSQPSVCNSGSGGKAATLPRQR